MANAAATYRLNLAGRSAASSGARRANALGSLGFGLFVLGLGAVPIMRRRARRAKAIRTAEGSI